MPLQPRAIGRARLVSKPGPRGATIGDLYQSGALKLLFPTPGPELQAILVNTAGGLTGGDCFELTAHAGAPLILTTQAAERAYRAIPGDPAKLRTRLSVAAGAKLAWLPQELILYEHCALDRGLEVDLEPGARFVLVEPVIFGRAAMGEHLSDVRFRDRIMIRRAGVPIFEDATDLAGDARSGLSRAATGAGAGAMVLMVLVDPRAEALLGDIRAMLPPSGGASCLAPDVLVLRCLAADGFILRQSLLPILDMLTGDRVPASWRL